VLGFTPAPKGKGKGKARDDGMRQTTLPFQPSRKGSMKNKKTNQELRLAEMALQLLGTCTTLRFPFIGLYKFIKENVSE